MTNTLAYYSGVTKEENDIILTKDVYKNIYSSSPDHQARVFVLRTIFVLVSYLQVTQKFSIVKHIIVLHSKCGYL